MTSNLTSDHRTTLSGCIFATKAFADNRKKINRNISFACPHNIMANFGPLITEIGLGAWGTPANFNGFRVLPSLLQRRRSPEANQTLHDVWQSPRLVHYIYIFESSCPLAEFAGCRSHLTSNSYVFLYWQRYCPALQQRA